MPSFAGVNHVALSVTDLERSQRFYTEVLGLLPVLDVGYGRVLMHNPSGFTVAVIRHDAHGGEPFSEATTGLDHLGLTAENRAELEAWQARFEELGVEHSPIQDTALGHHLNFRDPDGIALEFQAPTELYAAALADLRSREVSDAEILAVAEQLLGAELVARPS